MLEENLFYLEYILNRKDNEINSYPYALSRKLLKLYKKWLLILENFFK